VDFAAHVLKDVLPPARPLDVEEVLREVAKFYKLSADDLKSPRRHKHLVRARQVAMCLARKLTGASFPEIGHHFKRDHSTVMAACEKIESDSAADGQLKKELDELVSRLSR
jgi:chromosomal replication initiator protein